MRAEQLQDHFGMWWAVAIWAALYIIFLGFVPFYKKSQRKPTGAYAAFVVAFALEMFGVPFSMFAIAGFFGSSLPEGFLWGHTLKPYIGCWGMYLAAALFLTGGALVVAGWRRIHKLYWSKEQDRGELVTRGVYAWIRHPQYTGFLLITLGMICEWATIPMLAMWPYLLLLYYRLAATEEADMEAEFGNAYRAYKLCTGKFVPTVLCSKAAARRLLLMFYRDCSLRWIGKLREL